jgi:hypothetical protein
MKQHWSGDPAYEVPRSSALAEKVCEAAECGGSVWIDVEKMEMWLTDSAGIILYRCGFVLRAEAERAAARAELAQIEVERLSKIEQAARAVVDAAAGWTIRDATIIALREALTHER